MGLDDLDQPYTFTRFSQEWRLTLSGTVQMATGLKTGIEISEQTTLTQEIRHYPNDEVRLSSSSRAMSYNLFCEYRLDPKNPWDPRASFSLGHPWQGGVGLSLSLLRDPMVLVADISLRGQSEEPWSWLVLGLSAGFVANLWISISASAGLAVPLAGVGIPSTTLGIRTRYALDVKGKQEIGIRATLVLRGGLDLVELRGGVARSRTMRLILKDEEVAVWRKVVFGVVILSFGVLAGTPVKIADPGLEAAIREALGGYEGAALFGASRLDHPSQRRGIRH
jgi:hypothetical protein